MTTLSNMKRNRELVEGDNILKPIIAITPPENPPMNPYCNKLFSLLKCMFFAFA